MSRALAKAVLDAYNRLTIDEMHTTDKGGGVEAGEVLAAEDKDM